MRSMGSNHEMHPFDALTSALGGRRLSPVLWGLWLFLAICGHYAQMLPRRESVGAGAMIAVIVGIAGSLTYSWLLIRGLSSKARREEMLAKQSGVAQVRLAFRVMVWTIPVLALGAVLAPAVIR